MILPESLSPDYLTVREHHVTVTIEDNHAVTQVKQEFYNPHPFPVSGRYLFPVPPDALLSNFEAHVGHQRQTVVRQDAATTNAALYAAVDDRRDPSLLQYADWETLAFDIELPPHGVRTMTLSYEEVLPPNGGMLHYRYVLSTERYSAAPLEAVSIRVDVRSSAGLANLYSSSHDVTVERLGPVHAEVTWEAVDSRPTEDFELFIAPADGGFGGGLLTGKHDGRDHFLFLFAPEARANHADALPKDIVFVIDRSGSMSGEKIVQAQNALQFILGQLNENDRFSIVGFDDQMLVFSETLSPVDRQHLRRARGFVDELYANADTDIDQALQVGLSILRNSESRPGVSRMVVFLTDGLPTAGVVDESAIVRRATHTNRNIEARLHVFGVGYDVNTHLLDRLAAENGGAITYVQPGENLEVVLSAFYGKIAHPVLTDVQVEFEGMGAGNVYPQTLPDIFEGSSLMLTGKFQAQAETETVSVRVRGYAGEEQRSYVYHFSLADTDGHAFVPRLWATRRVGALLDEIRVEGETDRRVEEVRMLGLSYGIVTPYTTFAIAAQTTGAASMDNMSLYADQERLNAVSGETTIQARVQNQAYQDATQASLASGANIVQAGDRSLAQVSQRQIDLTLLQHYDAEGEALSDAWIDANVTIDRQITFGSEAYFALVDDPEIRRYLQSGTALVFEHEGEIIEIRDPEAVAEPEPDDASETPVPTRSGPLSRLLRWLNWLSEVPLSDRRR
jgi:Ca-activated chloride channel family protein